MKNIIIMGIGRAGKTTLSNMIKNKYTCYLSLEEAKRVLAIYENSEDPIEIRDSAMLHIFLNCGLRLSEIKGFMLTI